jgi:hypothetical protein
VLWNATWLKASRDGVTQMVKDGRSQGKLTQSIQSKGWQLVVSRTYTLPWPVIHRTKSLPFECCQIIGSPTQNENTWRYDPFAMMQMKINLATIWQQYKLTHAPGHVFELAYALNTRPKSQKTVYR